MKGIRWGKLKKESLSRGLETHHSGGAGIAGTGISENSPVNAIDSMPAELPENSGDNGDESASSNANVDIAVNIDTTRTMISESVVPLGLAGSSLADYNLIRDRSPRIKKSNPKYANLLENDLNVTDFACFVAEKLKFPTPETYEQAVNSKFANEWKLAMTEEIQSMYENNTWKLVPLPNGARTIDSKWVFKIKEGLNETELPRFKARLVAKGFRQREGIDYNEIFAPVIKYKTLRLLLAMTAFYDWDLEQMDVNTSRFVMIA